VPSFLLAIDLDAVVAAARVGRDELLV